MHEKQYAAMNAQGTIGSGLNIAREVDYDPTVEENIDNRIRHLEAELQRLRDSKAMLGPLLPMKISSLRNAMQY